MAKQKSTRMATDGTADIQSQIQTLAYQLWLERGSPIGSPDQDWLEAEARLAPMTRGAAA